MPPAGKVPDILSATSFPDILPGDGPSVPSHGSAPELYGGILICSDGQPKREGNSRRKQAPENQSRSKKAQPKRKGTKRSQSELEASAGDLSKKRGRPRVDTTDETASERRRTQIRHAQRAYRHRKESVISSLHQRVEDLEKTVDEMNKTFLAFNDEVMGSGILSSEPEFARQLHRATQRFLALAKVANPESIPDDDGVDITEDTHETEPGGLQLHSQAPSYSPLEDGQQSDHNLGWGSYRVEEPKNATGVTYNELGHQSVQNSKALSSTSTNLFSQEEQDWSFLESFFNSGVNMLEPKIPPSIDPPSGPNPVAQYTYSFLETTFARRLQRRCLEAGYSLLTNPSCDPAQVKKTFMLSPNLSSQSRLANVFLFLLQKKDGEPLEFWNAPAFSIGGAGTHYPRKDEYGNVIYPPNLHPPEKALERLGLKGLEKAKSGQWVQELIEPMGLGGQWFDCNDVEGYLSSKGIYLDSALSYAELPVPIIELPYGAYSSSSSTLSNSLEPGAPAAPIAPTQDPQVNIYTSSDFTSSGCSMLSPPFYAPQNGPYTQALSPLGIDGLNPPYLDTQSSGSASMSPNPSRVMDVDQFINKLIQHAICLGRAPAFKQTDVDAAITSSISPSC